MNIWTPSGDGICAESVKPCRERSSAGSTGLLPGHFVTASVPIPCRLLQGDLTLQSGVGAVADECVEGSGCYLEFGVVVVIAQVTSVQLEGHGACLPGVEADPGEALELPNRLQDAGVPVVDVQLRDVGTWGVAGVGDVRPYRDGAFGRRAGR